MQRFIVQIPGEFDAIEAGALAAKLKEMDIEVFLQDAQMAAAPEKPKRRAKSSEPNAGIQWSQDPILRMEQRAAVSTVLGKMQPNRIYTNAQIEAMVSAQGQWQTSTPFLVLARREGYLERKRRGRYVMTEKGRDYAASAHKVSA